MAMIALLLSTPLTHAGTSDKTVTLGFTPVEIEIEDGIVARVARGNDERVEIYCDEPGEIICKKNSRSGSLELKRKSRRGDLLGNLPRPMCIAIIVTKDPSAIREISCDSAGVFDGKDLIADEAALEADSGGVIRIACKGEYRSEKDSGGVIEVSRPK